MGAWSLSAANAAGQLLQSQNAESPFDRLSGDAAELGVSRLLEVVDMAARFAEKFVAGPAMKPQADLVRHRAGGNEQGHFLAQQSGDPLFELCDRGIFVKHVVADFGGSHRGPHPGRRLGDRVAAEVQRAGG